MSRPVTLASYRRPLLDGRAIEIRGRRVELTRAAMVALSQGIYWSAVQGISALVAGFHVSETRRGIRLALPDGTAGVIPKAETLDWVEDLWRGATERLVAS